MRFALALAAFAFLSARPLHAVTCSVLPANISLCASNNDCNSGGGQCVQNACKCTNGMIGEKCANANVNQNLGSMVITQAALTAYPSVYANFIQTTFDQVEAATLAATSYGPYCNLSGSSNDYYIQINQLTSSQVVASLDQQSITFQVVSGGFSFSAQASAQISNIKMDLLVGDTSLLSSCTSSQKKPIGPNDYCSITSPDSLPSLCFWYCDRTTSDYVNMGFTGTVTGNIYLVYNSTIQGLSASVQNVQVAMSPNNLNFDPHCTAHTHTSIVQGYLDSGVQSGAQQLSYMAAPVVAAKITTLVQQYALEYQGSQTYQAGNGTSFKYIVTSATINAAGAAGSHLNNVVVGLQGQVTTTLFFTDPPTCWVNVTYADTASDAALVPPTDWSAANSVTLNSGYAGPLIAGGRMTRSFMNALVWSQFWQMNVHGYSYTFTSNSLVLTGTTTWSNPVIAIPSTSDRITVALSGMVSGGCSPTRVGNVLSFNYDNIRGYFTVRFVASPSMLVQFQIIPGAFTVGDVTNTTAPYNHVLNGNNSLMRDALEGGLNFDTSQLNSFFTTNGNQAFMLPSQLQNVFPDGSVAIVSYTDGGIGTSGTSGYFELTGRCSCTGYSDSITNGLAGVETVAACPTVLVDDSDFCPLPSGRVLDAASAAKAAAAAAAAAAVPGVHARTLINTAEDNAALTVVLGELYQTCVTNAPTLAPSPPTPKPTNYPHKSPTTSPTYRPTTPTNMPVMGSGCLATKANGCYYMYDVVVFQCALLPALACMGANVRSAQATAPTLWRTGHAGLKIPTFCAAPL